MRIPLIVACFTMSSGGAIAGNSFVMPDGLNRAPAMVLHCTSDGANAAPCGTVSNPLIVGPIQNGATASNQTVEISAQQSLSQTVGTPVDGVYTGSGAGSVVSVLKALAQNLAAGVPSVPVGGQPVSRSISIGAQQSTALFATNSARHYLAFQAPSGTGIWVNLVGGLAAPNGIDCAYFSAGAFYESGNFVNRGSITVYAPVAITISAWEG